MKKAIQLIIGAIFLIHNINAQSLVSGCILQKDSSKTSIKFFKTSLAPKASEVYRFDFIKIFKNDSTEVLYPKDILGFTIGKKRYQSLIIKTAQKSFSIFAEVLQKGTATLYYYNGSAFGPKEIYIFNKTDDALYYISLEEKRAKVGNYDYTGGGAPLHQDLAVKRQMDLFIHNLSEDNAFKGQFLRYFSDCPFVVTKLKNDWYTSSNISILFQDYNSDCGVK